jgi:hypothetical protein
MGSRYEKSALCYELILSREGGIRLFWNPEIHSYPKGVRAHRNVIVVCGDERVALRHHKKQKNCTTIRVTRSK